MRVDTHSHAPVTRAPTARTALLTGSIRERSLARFGAEGPEVEKLQQALKQAGLFEGEPSGSFDRQTFAAVRAYQEQQGLQVDGVVGQQTWGAMLGQSYPPGNELLGGVVSVGGGAGPGATSSFDPASPAGSATGYVRGQATRIELSDIGDGERMRTDAAAAYKAMEQAAAREGINLSAVSGFRSMAEQERLYQMYKNGTGNLAARPGHSNHQGGLSVDIGGVGGYNTRTYAWLRQNAGSYGFQNDVAGEYWHWTYKR